VGLCELSISIAILVFDIEANALRLGFVQNRGVAFAILWTPKLYIRVNALGSKVLMLKFLIEFKDRPFKNLVLVELFHIPAPVGMDYSLVGNGLELRVKTSTFTKEYPHKLNILIFVIKISVALL